ncbi:PEGA domain-containing protein [Sorangium sp. So ce131]|uniref:PEGA domain-containing protein n=1 Tax=Sorangium sp. So ce131 TaxID=3133282 RepID=UPI003F62EDC4
MRRRAAIGLLAALELVAALPRRALGAPEDTPPREAQDGPAAAAPPAAAPAEAAPAAAPVEPAPASTVAPPAVAAAARRSEAVARYTKGRALYAEGSWAAALAEFLASRQLHPMWAATSSAALCLKQLKRHDEALDMFEALLRDFGAELPAGAKEVVQREVVELRGLVGTIEIDGAEPGAGVTIDGQSRGEFPLLAPLRVTAGSHVVRLAKEGFEPFERRVEVAGGQTARVAARLRALMRAGRLRVAEQGGRALDVVVDGSVVGKTPWEGRLAAGDHVVLLRGEGDLGTLPVSVSIELDRLTPITLQAEELAAALRIEPEPVNASVALDAVTVGRGIWEGRLRAGEHRIEIAAPGFVPEARRIAVARGERKVLRVRLGRDELSPFWRKPARPARAVVELGTALMLVPTFGGDITRQCGEDCRMAIGVGGGAVVHAGYELGMGLGFGVTVGHVAATQTISGRTASLTPVGLPAQAGTAEDVLALRAGLVGAWVGLTLGERWPLHFRLGVGEMLGTVLDTRTGEFYASDARSYPLDPAIEQHDAAFLHVTPEVRIGLPLGRHVELTAGVAAPVLISLTTPQWSEAHGVSAGIDGLGTFGGDALLGPVFMMLAPGIGARFDF